MFFVISFTNISGMNPVKTTEVVRINKAKNKKISVKTESFNIYQSDDMRLFLICDKIKVIFASTENLNFDFICTRLIV